MKTPSVKERTLFTGEAIKVWAVAWPLILTNMLQVLVGVVDFKMVGTLGVASIAAVGISRQVIMFLMVLMIAISGGSSVLIAHAHGAGDGERVGKLAAKSIVIMLAAALFIIAPAGFLFSRPILGLLGATSTVVDIGRNYLQILFAGSVFTMFNFAVSGVLLGVGKTRVSLVMLLAVNLLNVLLNYLFIFGPGPFPALGVSGAAVGTVAARGLGSIAGLWILVTKRLPIRAKIRDGFKFDLQFLKSIMRLGGPRSLQGIVRNFSRLMSIRIVTLLPDPTRSISAYSVAMQVRMISSFVGLAFMSAAMARVGQNLGAKDPEMAEKSGWISSIMAAGIMLIIAVVFLVIPEYIMAFFTKDTEVISMGRSFFMIIAVTEPIMAFAFALSGSLRGGGDPLAPFLYSSVSDLIVVILAGYLFAIPLGMGISGIALGIAVSSITRALPTTIRFRKGIWKKARL